jgi:hypothetical protein
MPLFSAEHMCLVQNFYIFWALSPYKALDVLFEVGRLYYTYRR